jgi:hypothetical protein
LRAARSFEDPRMLRCLLAAFERTMLLTPSF